MLDFQTLAALVFIILLSLFLFFQRRRIHLQKILFPFLYFVMYKTKLGLALMDSWAKKYKKLLSILGIIAIAVGFIGMVLIAVLLVKNLYDVLTKPAAAAGVALVLPFRVKGAIFVPFFYWIISIFIIAVIHEFAHGVIARLYSVKIKSSGFAALGILVPILPAAFVEPDEKQVSKIPKKHQLAIFAAGPFINIFAAIIIFLAFILFLFPLANSIMIDDGISVVSVAASGPAGLAGIQKNELIYSINNNQIMNVQSFKDILSNLSSNQQIALKTNISDYNITLAPSSDNPEKPYLGVSVVQRFKESPDFIAKYGFRLTEAILWFLGLLYWLYVLNLGIGLFNLVPLGPVDGGRMLLTTLQRFTDEKKAKLIWKKVSFFFLILIIANIAVAFV